MGADVQAMVDGEPAATGVACWLAESGLRLICRTGFGWLVTVARMRARKAVLSQPCAPNSAPASEAPGPWA